MRVDQAKMRQHIQEVGLKQSVIAQKIGITDSSLSLALLGKRKLEAGEYVSICNVLDVPLDFFIADEESVPVEQF